MLTNDAPLLHTAVQTAGLRWPEPPPGVSRKGGAGPSDHHAITIDGTTIMVPIYTSSAADSPFWVKSTGKTSAILMHNDEEKAIISLPNRPRFYDRSTADGIPYWKIATLHSDNVLATTLLQNCIRYLDEATSCQFCSIGQSLANGSTIARKSPEQLAEVAAAAVELDRVEQLVMTTGTPATSDRGTSLLVDAAAAVHTRVPHLPIQAQCEPPNDDVWFHRLADAGVVTLGMHLEAVTESVRQKIMPGKAEIPLKRYFEAFAAAVNVFGRGQVSTYVLAGLGDTPDNIVAIAEKLVSIGVYPFVVPFVPISGTPLAEHPAPSAEFMHALQSRLAPVVRLGGLSADSQKAGCGKCGACSTMRNYEGDLEPAAPKERIEC
jgi:radical SAM protein (TIGR04043 family)